MIYRNGLKELLKGKKMKAIIREETIEKKKIIYRNPIPKKAQNCIHHKGRNGKVRFYSEEEIFLYRLRAFNSSFNFQTI